LLVLVIRTNKRKDRELINNYLEYFQLNYSKFL